MRCHNRIFTCVALTAACLSTVAARGDGGADLLKSKGLVAQGNTYVLPAEKQLADAMRGILVLKAKVQVEDQNRAALENKIKHVKYVLQQLDFRDRNLMDQYSRTSDIDRKNNLVAQHNVLASEMKEGSSDEDDLNKQVNGISNDNRDAYITSVLDMGTTVDKAMADYKELAADDTVKAAIEEVNKTARVKLHLGPSQDFIGKAAFLKTLRGQVASDTIPIKVEGGVSLVEVTFNGTLTRTMVLDTGASLVCITADLAEQLNMVPGPTDPTLHLTLADGRVVEAKYMILKSVRVGQFTVKDVDCAVMPKDLKAATPLLGGSFLQKFIVKIDAAAGELHLAAVHDPNVKVTTGGPPAPKDTSKNKLP